MVGRERILTTGICERENEIQEMERDESDKVGECEMLEIWWVKG